MSIVAEACVAVALEGAIQTLIRVCQTQMTSRSRQKQVVAEMKKWPPLFSQLQMVIYDAEIKQLHNPMVRNWLVDLVHLIYDAEDIIEDFNFHVFYRQHQRKRDKLLEYVSHPVSSLKFNNLILSQLRAITNKLSSLIDDKERLDLLCTHSPPDTHIASPPASCLIADEVVYGRDQEKNHIVHMLLNDATNDVLGVIPIVGMGGMGKTTLARYAYNNERVVRHFHHRIWVSVSTDFDVLRITKSVLEAVTSRACEFTSFSQVQIKLTEAIQGTRFLLVLDDVWNENYQSWNTLRTPFTYGSRGSWIIVTTRSGEVADAMRTVDYKPLTMMEDDDCWKLFSRHANLDEEGDSEFKQIGREISERCKGLPLLAMVLGGKLRCNRRYEDWKRVWLKGCEDTEEGIRSVLRSSYYELPSHLKRCFVFCATFPPAYEFKENDLVLIWLGLGLISWEGTTDEEEDGVERKGIGHRCFRDLCFRSLFIPSGTYSFSFVMHDLVRDVANEFSAMACCVRGMVPIEPTQWFRTRHLSFHGGTLNTVVKEIKAQASFLPLRSFLPFDGLIRCNEPGNNLDSILPLLKHLRLLSLRRSYVEELPVSIGKLTHLRYLDLSDNHLDHSTTTIRAIPKSIALLYRLEILILKGCSTLSELPPNIGTLHSLKYLNASHTKITNIPRSIENLESLEYLILIKCDCLREIPLEIGSLKKLRQLNIALTEVRELPPTITNLTTLECLIARECKRLSQLPNNIGTLKKLRHLDTRNSEFAKNGVSPKGVSELTNLRFLSEFVVGRQNIAALENLALLRGELRISQLENVGTLTDVDKAKLWEKELDALTLEWSSRLGSNTPHDTMIEEQVIEKLRPHKKVKKLTLIGYMGTQVPSWFEDVDLKVLKDCPNIPQQSQNVGNGF